MIARIRSRLTDLGLQRRIQLLTAIGLVAVFLFFWFTGQRAVEESTRQSLDNQLTIARLIASSLEHRLSTTLALLEATAARPALSLADPSAVPVAVLRDAQLQLSTYGRRLLWLSTDGQVLWTEPLDAGLTAAPFPDFPAIRPALEHRSRHVSNLCRSPDQSRAYVLLAVPVLRPTGEIGSLLVEELDADQLSLEAVLHQVAPAGSHVEIVDHQGVVLASSMPELRFRKGDHTDQFTGLIDSRQPMVGSCHQCHARGGEEEIRQVQEVLTFAPLNVAPWGVAVRQPASVVMAPVNNLKRQVLLGGGATLAVALLVTSWFITRQIVRPIRALDEASVQFAAGHLDVPIPDGGIDEVARLSRNLEQMRVRLEATLADHRRWNEALAEMVEERTRELTALYEQLQGEEAMRKRLLGKVLTAQEEERARLARELHDTIGQSLSAIIMTTTAVESSLPATFVSGKEKLGNARSVAVQALHDLRNLIFDLRPEVLDDLGLALALRSQVKKHLEPAGVRVRLSAAGLKDQLPAEVETAVFRVVQEAITNIARHAHATQATISLTRQGNRLVVRVEDDGIGFEPARVMRGERKGWGLRGMEERITLLGGRFYVGSRPGAGTLVLAEVPLEQDYGQNEQDTRLDRR